MYFIFYKLCFLFHFSIFGHKFQQVKLQFWHNTYNDKKLNLNLHHVFIMYFKLKFSSGILESEVIHASKDLHLAKVSNRASYD